MSDDSRIVLITGASRGIGAAIARAFADDGATVIGTATSENGAVQISERLAHHQRSWPVVLFACVDTALLENLLVFSPKRFLEIVQICQYCVMCLTYRTMHRHKYTCVCMYSDREQEALAAQASHNANSKQHRELGVSSLFVHACVSLRLTSNNKND